MELYDVIYGVAWVLFQLQYLLVYACWVLIEYPTFYAIMAIFWVLDWFFEYWSTWLWVVFIWLSLRLLKFFALPGP